MKRKKSAGLVSKQYAQAKKIKKNHINRRNKDLPNSLLIPEQFISSGSQ